MSEINYGKLLGAYHNELNECRAELSLIRNEKDQAYGQLESLQSENARLKEELANVVGECEYWNNECIALQSDLQESEGEHRQAIMILDEYLKRNLTWTCSDRNYRDWKDRAYNLVNKFKQQTNQNGNDKT